MRLNAHKLKDLEHKARQHQRQVEEEQAAQAVKAVHFADKYQHIQPKVTTYMKVGGSVGGWECMLEGICLEDDSTVSEKYVHTHTICASHMWQYTSAFVYICSYVRAMYVSHSRTTSTSLSLVVCICLHLVCCHFPTAQTGDADGVVGSTYTPSPRQPRAERPHSATRHKNHSQSEGQYTVQSQ